MMRKITEAGGAGRLKMHHVPHEIVINEYLIDLSSGDIVVTSQLNIKEPLVVSKIQVHLHKQRRS